jgi:hypothetical protein
MAPTPTRGFNTDPSPSSSAQGQGDLLDQQPSSGAATGHVGIGIGIAILILVLGLSITTLVYMFLAKKRRRSQSSKRSRKFASYPLAWLEILTWLSEMNYVKGSPPPYSYRNAKERSSRDDAPSTTSSVTDLVKEPQQAYSNRRA